MNKSKSVLACLKELKEQDCNDPVTEVNRQQEKLDSLYSELANALNEIESLKGKVEENQVTIESLKEQLNKMNTQ